MIHVILALRLWVSTLIRSYSLTWAKRGPLLMATRQFSEILGNTTGRAIVARDGARDEDTGLTEDCPVLDMPALEGPVLVTQVPARVDALVRAGNRVDMLAACVADCTFCKSVELDELVCREGETAVELGNSLSRHTASELLVLSCVMSKFPLDFFHGSSKF